MDLEKFMRRAAKTYKKVDTDKLIRNVKRTAEDLAEEFLPEEIKESRTFKDAKTFTDEVLGETDSQATGRRSDLVSGFRQTLNEAKKVADELVEETFTADELEEVELLGEDEFMINMEDENAPANKLVGDLLQAAKTASQDFVQQRKHGGRADDPMDILKDVSKVADSALREVLEKDEEIVRQLRKSVNKVTDRFTGSEKVGEIFKRGASSVLKDDFVDSLVKEAEAMRKKDDSSDE